MPILAAVAKLHGAGLGEQRQVGTQQVAGKSHNWLFGVCVGPATSDDVRPVVMRFSPG